MDDSLFVMLKRRVMSVKMGRYFCVDSLKIDVYNGKQRKDKIGLKEPK
jgi:hypothetical protein